MGLGDSLGVSFGVPGVSLGALGGVFWSLCSGEPSFLKNELRASTGARFSKPTMTRERKARDKQRSNDATELAPIVYQA